MGRRLVTANAELSDRIDDALTHSRLIRGLGTSRLEAARFARAAAAVQKASLHAGALGGIPTPATELMAVPLMFGAVGIGLALDIGLPTLLAYLLLLYRLQPHVRHLDHLRLELAALSGPIEDIVAILDLDDPTAPRSGSRPIERVARDIRFERVSFAYGVREEAGISDVSFTIPKGRVMALVGPSGAGKSTIVALLHRLFDPAEAGFSSTACRLPSSTSTAGGSAWRWPGRMSS